jgi:hypothetical protein
VSAQQFDIRELLPGIGESRGIRLRVGLGDETFQQCTGASHIFKCTVEVGKRQHSWPASWG